MSDHPPIMTQPCPHCQGLISISAPYCPKCGYRLRRVDISSETSQNSPFNIGLIAILMFLVPAATCGGCALVDNVTFSLIFMGVIAISFGLGSIMLFANFIAAVTRKR